MYRYSGTVSKSGAEAESGVADVDKIDILEDWKGSLEGGTARQGKEEMNYCEAKSSASGCVFSKVSGMYRFSCSNNAEAR